MQPPDFWATAQGFHAIGVGSGYCQCYRSDVAVKVMAVSAVPFIDPLRRELPICGLVWAVIFESRDGQ